MNQYWNRRRGECEIVVVDLDNKHLNFKVKLEIRPEQILQEIKRDDCYLVCNGNILTPGNIRKHIKEKAVLHAVQIRDRG